MNKRRVIRHRTILGSWGAGWMTPQLQIQITPLCWRFEFLYCSTDGRPVKLGGSLGCVSLVLFFGKASYGTGSGYSDRNHLTMVE